MMKTLYYKKADEKKFSIISNCDGEEKEIFTCESIDDCEFWIDAIKEVLDFDLIKLYMVLDENDQLDFQKLLTMALAQIKRIRKNSTRIEFPYAPKSPSVAPQWDGYPQIR